MLYSIDYDICALLILIFVLMFNYTRKQTPLLQNRFFIAIIWNVIITTIFELLSTLYDIYYNVWPNWLGYFINCFYFISLSFIPLLYTYYCIAMTEVFEYSKKRTNFFAYFLIAIPFLISFVIILLTPFVAPKFTLTFSIDSSGIYHREQSGFKLMYGIAGFYLLASFVILVIRIKIIKLPRAVLMSSFIIASLISVVVQLIEPRLVVQCFGISYSLLLFSFSVQRPEERLDSVTDLFNAEAFAVISEKKFKSNKTFLCAGIMIENMPYVISTFGIKNFNKILNLVSTFFKKEYSKKCTLFYLSQGHFCIIFKQPLVKEAYKILSEILTRFQIPWGTKEDKANELMIKLNIRSCLITCPQDAQTSEEIIDTINHVAENALYRRGGIAHISNYDRNRKKKLTEIDFILRNALNNLEKGALNVYYQAIYSTAKKRLIGAEALIRMRDIDGILSSNENKKGEFISPEEFIPIAEKNGTIYSLGEYVFEKVCQMLSSNSPEKYGIEKIELNLSVVQCMQEDVVDYILQIKDMYKVDNGFINLEVTETAAAYQVDTLLKTMERLIEEGIEFSLDDYGKGHATMDYLINLPFETIKIDKDIIWNAYSNPSTNVALATTITMIKDLGKKVLAEGVETEDQAKWLTDLGCDYLQGYYFSRPLPKEEFLELMKEKNTDIYNNYIEELPLLEEA